MARIGTFGSFTQARLAIYASQAGLQVAGNNIANINTDGYTRQKLEQTSFYSGGSDRYYSHHDIRVGNGVLTTGVSQIRDPYLDIRYREEIASVGAMDAKLAGLESVQRILDEVGEGDDAFGILEAQFSEVYDALMQLTDQTGHQEYDIQVRASAKALTDQMRSYAAQLKSTYENAVDEFTQNVEEVNTILRNIRDLNRTIRKAEIHGDPALEPRDERNLLIDRLAEFMDIDVVYTEEDIGAGQTVEKLSIYLSNANPDGTVTTDSSTLVDGIYGTQFLIDKTMPEINPNYDPNANPPQPYLDANGNPTDDVTQANQVENTNFNLTLEALKDSQDRLMYELQKIDVPMLMDPQPGTPGFTGAWADGQATTVNNGDGTYTITTYQKQDDAWYSQTYIRKPSERVALDDNDLYGALQSQREFLTEEGEFSAAAVVGHVDENAASKRGVKYYQKALDLLANQFAAAMNEANTGYLRNTSGEYIQADGTVIQHNGVTLTADMELTEEQKATLEAQGKQLGGVLFSNHGDGDDPTGINASNITISHTWSLENIIVRSYVSSYNPEDENGIASTDSSNVLHMANLFFEKMDYKPDVIGPANGNVTMFHGNFQEMWTHIGATLGNDMMETETMLDSFYASSIELDTSRDSVSSVDLNDEAMNLMQYSKSYNAACRLMTTIDSILDKLINGTGLTR